MNLITPLIFLIISGISFFAWINPIYQGAHVDSKGKPDSIVALQATNASYDKALLNQVKLKNKIIALTESKSAISQTDITRLDRMLPSSVDNVRLIVEIESIVKKYNTAGFKSISVSKNDTQTSAGGNSVVATPDQYSTLSLNFSVTMSYANFVNFLHDLEDSLRLVDINNITFTANDTDTYDFSVALKTYWLNNSNK